MLRDPSIRPSWDDLSEIGELGASCGRRLRMRDAVSKSFTILHLAMEKAPQSED